MEGASLRGVAREEGAIVPTGLLTGTGRGGQKQQPVGGEQQLQTWPDRNGPPTRGASRTKLEVGEEQQEPREAGVVRRLRRAAVR